MPAWKLFGGRGRGGQPGSSTRPPKETASINDNYCIVNPVPVARSVEGVLNVQRQDFSVTVQPQVLFSVISPVHFFKIWKGSHKRKT